MKHPYFNGRSIGSNDFAYRTPVSLSKEVVVKWKRILAHPYFWWKGRISLK